MSWAEILLLSVALAMDAFAVSWAAGAVLGTATPRQTFRLSFHFGLFQAVMPILGWFLGGTFARFISSVDHWIAFGLLALVGGRMVLSAVRGDEEEDCCDPTRGMTLVVLAVATSIDALAVGLSLSMLKMSVWIPALAIGLTAAAFSALGIHLGRAMGRIAWIGRWAEGLGGLVLLGIGLRILAEHGALG